MASTAEGNADEARAHPGRWAYLGEAPIPVHLGPEWEVRTWWPIATSPGHEPRPQVWARIKETPA